MKNRFFATLALLFAFGVSSVHPADAAVQYDVVDLGFFNGTSINNSGEVSGIGPSTKRYVANAYLWNGTFIDLGSLGINASSGSEFASNAVRVDSLGRAYGTSAYFFTPIGFFNTAFVWDGLMHAVAHPRNVISCQATSANEMVTWLACALWSHRRTRDRSSLIGESQSTSGLSIGRCQTSTIVERFSYRTSTDERISSSMV